MAFDRRRGATQDEFYDDILREKYCKDGERSAAEVMQRVARGLAAADRAFYGGLDGGRRRQHAARFLGIGNDRIEGDGLDVIEETCRVRYLEAMEAGFIPAGRIMSACGSGLDATLINCFVQPVGDSISEDSDGKVSIYKALLQAAETMRRGGGVGYDFSRIRPRGALVRATHSHASGPLSYMRVFDRSCETVESAGARRGAQMGILRCDHPDILEFVAAKDLSRYAGLIDRLGLPYAEAEELRGRLRTLANFNISVAVTDAFMTAVVDDREFDLVHRAEPGEALKAAGARRRDDGQWVYRSLRARELLDAIIRHTYDGAEPGVVFIDRMNTDDNLSYCERIEACNPCVTADTWVMTSDGARQVRSLLGQSFACVVNGRLFSAGNAGFFRSGSKPVLKLSTREGFSLRVTQDHLICKHPSGSSDMDRWIKAGDLKAGDEIVLNNHRELSGWDGIGTVEEGYLLGLLMGDGTLKEQEGVLSVWEHGGGQSVMDAVTQSAVCISRRADHRGWHAVRGRREWRYKSVGLRRLADRFGMAQRKRISEEIEETSSDFYRGFLRGFFDADGSVQGSQAKGISVRLSQSDMAALEGTQRMLARLGIISTIYRNRRGPQEKLMPDGKGGFKPYRIKSQHELVIGADNLVRFADLVGFADSEKQERLKRSIASYRRAANRERFVAVVEAVDHEGVEDVYDVQIPGINAFDANGIVVHNCGEQPLPDYGCCCLGSINLTRFVQQPFAAAAAFDFERLRGVVRTAVRMLDNVLDVSYWPLPEQQREAEAKRRIGLGFTGLGSALAMLGRVYGEDDGVAFAGEVAQVLRDEAYRASVALAQEKGAFPLFDAEKYLQGGFVQRLPAELREAIAGHGLRNSHLLSIAPTGTISLAFGRNVSGGIEPAFAWTYWRSKRGSDGRTRRYEVQDYAYRRYVEQGGDPQQLPRAFVNAQTLSAQAHLRMQAAVQPYIDSSISKTINVPEDYPFADFKDLYLQAWRLGCKGCTTYRPNESTGMVLSVDTKKNQPQDLDQSDPDRRLRLDKVPVPALASLKWPGRPVLAQGNPAWTYMVEGDTARFAVFVGHVEGEERYPFEVWVNGAEQPRGLGATAKLLSMDMRSRDRGWLQYKLELLIQTGGAPIRCAMPPTGEVVAMSSATAAMARLVKLRCEQLGAFAGQGATPVLDALMSPKEPRTGADGTLSWTVDVANPATGDDLTVILKELVLPDGQRRPYAVSMSGTYPRDFDGLCRLLSCDMRVIDPAWIGAKLAKLLNYQEPAGAVFAGVPGQGKSMLYPSTIAYVATLILHRYQMLGILDALGHPTHPMGVLEAPGGEHGSEAGTPAAAHIVKGDPCPDCGTLAVVLRDGCKVCTACGWVGACG